MGDMFAKVYKNKRTNQLINVISKKELLKNADKEVRDLINNDIFPKRIRIKITKEDF